jgi:ATP-dependent RNA helicase DeaD
MYTVKFEELNLSDEILKAVAEMGYEEATPIQSQAIPLLLDGKDIIGQAQTGTGKTASFGIPIIEKVTSEKVIQALILCPTRELSIQVAEELSELLKYKKGIHELPIYGGQPIERQIKALKNGTVQIVIATPGRLKDHIMRKTIKLDKVDIVVLDEADEMLDMGFRDDIEFILKTVRESRQTVLFSATMPKSILELSKKYLKKPEMVKVVPKELTVPKINQYYLEMKPNMKLEVLTRLIDIHDPELSIVFCNTKRGVDKLVSALQARGYFAEGLHGDLRQQVRDKVMGKFRSGDIEILVATDVAARGIDVDEVDAVFNYDLPQDIEYYIHRIGRTARAGRSGQAFTFVTGKDIFKIRDIEKYTKKKIIREKVPTVKDVEMIRTNEIVDEVKGIIDEGTDFPKYREILDKLLRDDYTSAEIATGLLKILIEGESNRKEDTGKESNGDKSKAAKGGMVRLFVNLGKKQNIQPKDLVGAFSGEAGMPGKAIGAIDIFDKFSFVEIEAQYVDKALLAMNKARMKGKNIFVEPANERN